MPDGANIVVGGSGAPGALANSVLGNPTGVPATSTSIPHTGAARDFCALATLAAQRAYLAIPAPISYPVTIAQGGTESTTAAGARGALGAAGLVDNQTFSGINNFTGTGTFYNSYNVQAVWTINASWNINASQFYANNVQFYFKGNDGVKNASFVMQNDNNFVLYTVNASGAAQPIIAVFSGVTNPSLTLYNAGLKATGLFDPGAGNAHLGALWLNGVRTYPSVRASFDVAKHATIGIPADCAEIIIRLWYASVTSTPPIIVQVGSAAGTTSAGYNTRGGYYTHGNWNVISDVTYGFPFSPSSDPAGWISATMRLYRLNDNTNWSMESSGTTNVTNSLTHSAGSVTVSGGILTYVVITIASANFDGGYYAVDYR